MSNPSEQKASRLKAAAQRAKAEAEARRAQKEGQIQAAGGEPGPKEIDGRGGLDPVRYDDWEIKGLTSDF
ncbi:MAG: DUF1674 domain-containing protein [Devosiaceae bacterium]